MANFFPSASSRESFYGPNLKVRCFKCGGFGHRGVRCWKNEEFSFLRSAEKCWKCGVTGHVAEHCREKQVRCFSCGGSGHKQGECKSRMAHCWNCGEKGHIKRDCKKELMGMCFHCHKVGHHSKDCGKKSCWKCSSTDHLLTECPDNRRQVTNRRLRQQGGQVIPMAGRAENDPRFGRNFQRSRTPTSYTDYTDYYDSPGNDGGVEVLHREVDLDYKSEDNLKAVVNNAGSGEISLPCGSGSETTASEKVEVKEPKMDFDANIKNISHRDTAVLSLTFCKRSIFRPWAKPPEDLLNCKPKGLVNQNTKETSNKTFESSNMKIAEDIRVPTEKELDLESAQVPHQLEPSRIKDNESVVSEVSNPPDLESNPRSKPPEQSKKEQNLEKVKKQHDFPWRGNKNLAYTRWALAPIGCVRGGLFGMDLSSCKPKIVNPNTIETSNKTFKSSNIKIAEDIPVATEKEPGLEKTQVPKQLEPTRKKDSGSVVSEVSNSSDLESNPRSKPPEQPRKEQNLEEVKKEIVFKNNQLCEISKNVRENEQFVVKLRNKVFAEELTNLIVNE